jgi:hypothetical protein
MLYEIRPAEFGQGLFARETIAAGTLIWSYKLNENVVEYDEPQAIAHLASLPSLCAQQRFLDLTFGRGDRLCLITDAGQYMNHAPAPLANCMTDMTTGDCFALRTIAANEQLFEDYSTFAHPPFLRMLLAKYQCEPAYYDLPKI